MLMSAGHAAAARPPRLDIPAGPLRAAVVAIGAQAGVTIGLSDPAIAGIAVPRVGGRITVAAALARLLAGTAADYRVIDAQTFVIVRRAAAPARPPPPPRAAANGTDPAIVVTGSKRSSALQDYIGSVTLVDAAAVRPNLRLHGSQALVEQLPVMASTHLGPGRNKLFIRGIADSSFNGPTEATVGQYLGEMRLNYNAPDPELVLYDIASVEVLEGPQGALYGAGSLGGIVRLVPVAPDLAVRTLDVAGGGLWGAHGGPGGDASAVLNLPIVRDRLGLRVVGYGGIDGGYIDDPSRGLKDINRTTTRGVRATLRYQPAGWTIDIGAVIQDINSRDGQYAERGLPPLRRSSVLAQPFDNDYALAGVTVRHAIGAAQLVSTTSLVRHIVVSSYDASLAADAPRRYRERNRITLLTNETRLSRQYGSGSGWVFGAELLRSGDRLTRTLGPPGTGDRIAGANDVVEEASLFGDGTLRLAPRWFVTAGARLEHARLIDHILDQEEETRSEPHRHANALLPSAGLLWKAATRLSVYARYQEAFRPGGLSTQDGVTQRFESDSVASVEAGIRYGGAGDRLTASAAASFTHWKDIQADLVDDAGLPYTTNIGTGRIVAFEAQASWRPSSALALDGAVFVNKSRLSRPAAGFAGERDATLPNIADAIARIGARYTLTLGGREVSLSGSARYVGRSRLGVGTALDLHQGRYVDTAVGATVPFGRVLVSLDATNLLDRRGNIFALGNPFGVMAGNQITPQRPRTVRIGAAVRF